MAKNSDLDFSELEFSIFNLPKFEGPHVELLDIENLLEYELKYQVSE